MSQQHQRQQRQRRRAPGSPAAAVVLAAALAAGSCTAGTPRPLGAFDGPSQPSQVPRPAVAPGPSRLVPRGAAGVLLSVEPRRALLDVPVTVTADGLPARALATVTATAADASGQTWRAGARFVASAAGVVTTTQPAVGGSYRGVLAMGLFQLMRAPGLPSVPDTDFLTPAAGYPVTVAVSVGGVVLATRTIRRDSPAAEGVVADRVDPASGVEGTFYDPPDPGAAARPAVLVLGGGDPLDDRAAADTADTADTGGPGGSGSSSGASRSGASRSGASSSGTDALAALLAAHGYPTLAIAYRGAPGLPAEPVDLPLEYLAAAARLLAARPGVDPEHVVVEGAGRASEAALLLGAHYPGLVHAVIAAVPSSTARASLPAAASPPSWTLHGRAVPTAPAWDDDAPTPVDAPAAVIAVERIRGPLFTVCAGRDAIWDSCAFTGAITARRRAHHGPAGDVALAFPRAGHGLAGLVAYGSSTSTAVEVAPDVAVDLGGTLTATAAGLGTAHARLLAFLAAL